MTDEKTVAASSESTPPEAKTASETTKKESASRAGRPNNDRRGGVDAEVIVGEKAADADDEMILEKRKRNLKKSFFKSTE